MIQPIMECRSLNASVQVMHAAIPDEMGKEPIHLYGFNIWQQYLAYSWVRDPTASQELFATQRSEGGRQPLARLTCAGQNSYCQKLGRVLLCP